MQEYNTHIQVNNNNNAKSPFNSINMPRFNHFDLGKKMFDMTPFRTTAAHFEEFGQYPHYRFKDYFKLDRRPESDFSIFWKEEKRRCLEGLRIGSNYVTGMMYAHLNYGRMNKVVDMTEEQAEAIRRGETIEVKKKPGFPDPWDSTWHILNYWQDCKELGKHFGLLKSRGLGATYILTTIATNIYYHWVNGKVLVVAPNESQLIGADAILTRIWEHMDFIEQHTPFFKIREGGGANTKFQRKSKIIKRVDGISTSESDGNVPTIQGIQTKSADTTRGMRADVLIMDEAGANRNVKEIFSTSLRAFEQNAAVYGTIMVLGTGGSKVVDLAGFQRMIEYPEAYHILGMPDVFSKVSSGTDICLFMGAYWNNMGYFDAQGCSDQETAYKHELRARLKKTELVGKGTPEDISYQSENAMHPEEALRNNVTNGMPLLLLEEQYNFVKAKKFPVEIGRMNILNPLDGIFIPDDDCLPLNDFPLKGGRTYVGAVVLSKRYNPDHKYGAGVDPYAHDDSNDGEPSHGSIKIFDLTDDIEVAVYTGRPVTNHHFMKICVALGSMYHCDASMMFENNIPEFRSEFKLLNAVHLLATQPTLLKEYVPNSKVQRPYGCHKISMLYNLSLTWMIDWMLEEYGDSGLLKINTIFDMGYLRELIKSAEDLNFDRLNAASMTFIQRKEYQIISTLDRSKEHDKGMTSEYKKHLLKVGGFGEGNKSQISPYDR